MRDSGTVAGASRPLPSQEIGPDRAGQVAPGTATASYATGIAGALEDLCRYLAACYYEPSAAFVEERLFDSMYAAATAIEPDLARCAGALKAAFAADPVGDLLVDYARLFVGPGEPAVMPYASCWLSADPSTRHEATTAVLDAYAAGGFDLSDDFRELPDHVAVELEFLYALSHALNQAFADGRVEVAAEADSMRRRFIVGHLGNWIGGFTDALRASAGTLFYRELGEFTRRFVGLLAAAESRT